MIALLRKLLTVNPEHRCSCLLDIRTSASLSDVVWEDVLEKKVEPGFVPNASLGSLYLIIVIIIIVMGEIYIYIIIMEHSQCDP
ncbi:hypothetical protein GDO81_003991 [Engystomops pustulosus]|uniref:Uncharacterized protein n=1 Tax=Engystomops pustulosus TaxID=76066 RepID=A0AAV6ZPB1_ENGPU|nr:hypothetical protein GDO81_003991 [Engystomops pustulosus]